VSEPALLVVDDDLLFCESLVDYFAGQGIVAAYATSIGDAVSQSLDRFTVVVVDNHLPDGEGLALVDAAALRPEGPSFIMVTGDPSYDHAVASMRRRVIDYLAKPIELHALGHAVLRAIPGAVANGPVPAPAPEPGGDRLGEALCRYARSEVPILITGETGTGKTRLARQLHAASGRARGPFVAVNCATLVDSIAEAELFGSCRGAFTGATERRGLVQLAAGGTLFLDEIGELSRPVQAKLLSVLEEQRVRPVGGTRWSPADLRVMAATHVDLEQAVSEGRFRADLLFRIDVGRVEIPALRERPERLAGAIVELLGELRAPAGARLAPGELSQLEGHDWPGNYRELRNLLARALVLHPPEALRPSQCARPRALGSSAGSVMSLGAASSPASAVKPVPALPAAPAPSPSPPPAAVTLAQLERRHVLEVLELHEGHRARSARALGISEATLRRKLRAWSGETEQDARPS